MAKKVQLTLIAIVYVLLVREHIDIRAPIQNKDDIFSI